MTTAAMLVDTKATLGEGAIWDQRSNVLWWVDIDGRSVHRFDPATGADRAYAVPTQVGTVVPRTRGGVVVALRDSIAALDADSGALSEVARIDQPGHRFNDGKCDPAGRLWVGGLALDFAPGASALYRLAPGGALEPQVHGVTISNGLAWSKDRTTFWYVDTPTRRLDAFDYDHASGAISNRRTAITFPDSAGFPDGMAIDHEDMLWVAMWEGGAVLRCDPRRGTILDRIAVPGARDITSCAFGGRDLDVLYITSAGGNRRTAEQPLAGALYSARPGIRGVPTDFYAG